MIDYTVYDRKEEYNAEIIPKINEIKGLCIKYNIPFIMAYAVENTEEKTTYAMDGLMPGVQDVHLKDNKLKDVFGIMSGYMQSNSINYNELEDDFPDNVV